MRIKAPWGCDDPYCWNHVLMAVFMIGIPILYVIINQ